MPAHIISATFSDATTPALSLAEGTVLHAVIRGAEDSPWITTRGLRIDLTPAPQLQPGSTVRLEVIRAHPTLQLRLLPHEHDSARPGRPDGQALPGGVSWARALPVVQQLLQQLEVSLLSPEEALALTPEQMPLTATALRQLFALFVTRESLGAVLNELQGMMRAAVDAGVLLPADNVPILTLFSEQDIADPAQAARLLVMLRQSQPTEARLAAGARSPDLLDEFIAQAQQSLRSQLTALSGQEALLNYLRGKGQLRRFEMLVRHAQERLDGAQLQNLHASRRPYLFLEAPLAPELDISQCRIHIFPEREERGRNATGHETRGDVVFDLETRHLGSLWIRLTIATTHCRCVFKTTGATALARLEAAMPELCETLSAAGYASPHIRIERWDGNRLLETTRLMRQFASINYDG